MLDRSFAVVRGDAPLVLVAPHGGRRDAARRPWTAGGLKTNDLYTADLTRVLAARSGASALVNDHVDRNDVDLNRITAAHDDAPQFLEALADLLRHALSRHGRASVLTIHGWNAIGPAVDVGFGRRPGPDAGERHRPLAVSDAFLRTAAATLMRAATAAGLTATPGVRYPARARENLLQLFTGRHAGDARPLVRTLSALGARCDAVQLELAVPLRFPGRWRGRFEQAFLAALPALLDPGGTPPLACPLSAPVPPPGAGLPRSLEFVGESLSGLASVDRLGGRLLLFEPGGRLVMCTRERLPGDTPGRIGRMRLDGAGSGALRLRFDGPMCAFPDTAPFLDLEHGLARAHVVPVEVDLLFEPAHGPPDACPFGRTHGTVTLDDRPIRIDGPAHAGAEPWSGAGIRLRLEPDLALVASENGPDGGFACRQGRHVALASCAIGSRGPREGAGALDIEAITIAGDRIRVATETVHELPVVRGHTRPAVRVVFAACRLAGAALPAGWCRREE